MPTVRISNIDCYYEIQGEGKPLVLIAGLGSDSQSWQPALSELVKHFKVVTFDNRGIGRTKCPGDNFDIATLARDTVGLIDALGIEKANILGHSMGAYIAQELAITHPQRVEKLILAAACAVTSQRNRFIFDNMISFLESGIEYELFIKEFFCWIFSPEFFNNKENLDAAIKYALDYPYPITLDGFRQQVQALNSFSSLDRLDKIKAETLLIVGIKDILITLEEAGILIKKIPSLKPVFLERAAHSVHVEDAQGFVENIVNFLQ